MRLPSMPPQAAVWMLGIAALFATSCPSDSDSRSEHDTLDLEPDSSHRVTVRLSRELVTMGDHVSIAFELGSTAGIDASLRVQPDEDLPEVAVETQELMKQRTSVSLPDGGMLYTVTKKFSYSWAHGDCLETDGEDHCLDLDSLEAACAEQDPCELSFTIERKDHGDPWPERTWLSIYVGARRNARSSASCEYSDEPPPRFPENAKLEIAFDE